MSLHDQARQTLLVFDHPDPAQHELAQDYRDFLETHADGVFRECRVGHITASALVVSQGAEQILLTLHPKVGRWLQLGGHLEAGDASVRDAAIREVIEECGIDAGVISAHPLRLDRHPVPCGRDADGNPLASEHLDVQFLVVVPEAIEPTISEESDDLSWFPRLGLPQVDASVQALVDDARRVLGASSDRPLEPLREPNWVTFG